MATADAQQLGRRCPAWRRSSALPTSGPCEDQEACRLYKIGLGRAHKGRAVKLLIADRNIRVIDSEGELIRELTLDPSRNYQPLGQGLVSPMS